MLRRTAESLSEILGADGGRKDLFTSTVSSVSSQHEAYRGTYDDGLKLPLVIEPANFDTEDFFVSVATYHQARAPLSAYVHVLDEECSRYFHALKREFDETRFKSDYRVFGALGAAVGETFLAAQGSAEAGAAPSYASCKRSLSFVLAKARTIYPSCHTEYVASRWASLRRLTGFAVSSEAVVAVQEAHSFLFGGDENLPDPLRKVLSSARSVSAGDQAVQRALLNLYPEIAPFASELAGPFDARMKAFSQLVEQVHLASRGASFDSLAVGFFANRIQPGSFAHARALLKLADFLPTALVWYGMFCALSEEFRPADFGSGLVAKLARDATQPFSFEQRPSCDISLDELQVLARMPLRAEVIKPIQQKIAVVALLPGVDISSRYSADEDHHLDDNRDRRMIENDELSMRVAMLLEDALGLIRRRKSSARRVSDVSQKRPGKSRL